MKVLGTFLHCFLNLTYQFYHFYRKIILMQFLNMPLCVLQSIGLHHPLDGITNPKYKLLRFIQLTIFLQKEEGTSF